jgi:hypothetical protein
VIADVGAAAVRVAILRRTLWIAINNVSARAAGYSRIAFLQRLCRLI